ncbi:MAG: ATP-binding protein [Roseobacter sp.]
MSHNYMPSPGSAPLPSDEISVSSQEMEDFVYIISHDVRNSVRALIELPQWIADDLAEAGVRVDGSVADSIELMNKHTGRLDRMLVDLLTLSRVGRMQTVTQVSLDEVLTEVLDEMAIPPDFQIIRGLDCATLTIGERDILTLLNALISNALKHHDTKAGKVVITSHKDKADTVITVRDDGPGIPAKFRERVFSAMTTLVPRDEVEGSGMGLAITRKIATMYSGKVSILETAGQRGTTIEARFPSTRMS